MYVGCDVVMKEGMMHGQAAKADTDARQNLSITTIQKSYKYNVNNYSINCVEDK